MDFWKEISYLEKSIFANLNANTALKLRANSQICASMIEIAKYSMYLGRINRAWAYLITAKKFWDISS